MEPGGSMRHSQGLSSNPYPESNQPNSLPISLSSILVLSSHIRLGLRKGLFPAGMHMSTLAVLIFTISKELRWRVMILLMSVPSFFLHPAMPRGQPR